MIDRTPAVRSPAEVVDRRGAMVPADGPSDADILSQFAAGDHRAMKLLYGRYARPAYSLARRICNDEGLAEDVIQEVFLVVWREPSRYDPERGRFVTWLLTLVHHRSVDSVRWQNSMRRRSVTLSGDEEDLFASPEPGADEAAIGAVLAGQVRDAMGRLPAEQREALTLTYFGGYTHYEVAAFTGVPVGTVKSRLSAGVRRLRILLAPWFSV